jgi:acetyl esterase
MTIPFATLPGPIRRLLQASAHALAYVPGLRPARIDGHRLDPEVSLGLLLHRLAGKVSLASLTPEEAREEHGTQVYPYTPRARAPVSRTDFEIGGLPVRRYRAKECPVGGAAIVWYHGGGWVIGSIESDDLLCSWIAELTGLPVFSVEYRLGPEHRFPTAHEDAIHAWTHLLERATELGFDPARAAVAGSSAGANLSGWVSVAARDRGLTMPAVQLLFYPAAELVDHEPSRTTLAAGFVLDRELLSWFEGHYLDPKDLIDPRVSLLRTADFTGLPPAHIVTAGFDPLRDEGERLAERLEAAGVPVSYECAGAMIHGFVELSGGSYEASRVTESAFVRLVEALG